ncbi:MAG: metallophosphoesterase [Armatimonadota bacterium]|nr:metallophosphoesterase [Armatimonadota bacterium]
MSRRGFLKLAMYGALVAAGSVDALAVEPRWLETTRHSVPLRRLPQELDGFTIAQLTDIHRGVVVPDNLICSAVEIINGVSPDLVVATGDFVNRGASNAGPCAKILSGLSPRLGTYAVLGNHDHWTDPALVRGHLERSGILVLGNANVRLAEGLTLLGVDDYWAGEPDFDKTWRGANVDDAHVLLSHNPMAVKEIDDRECFMIAGHTHGGQVNLPIFTRHALARFMGWKYLQGWFHVGKVTMYVSRGIGVVNPPVRFRCRPEIALFTLRSAQA